MKMRTIGNNGNFAAAAVVGMLMLAGSAGASVGAQPISATEQRAVSDVADSIDFSAAALSPLDEMSGLSNAPSGWRAAGTHPTVTVSRTTSATTVTINYGTGITGPAGVTRSGMVVVTIDKTGKTGSVTFTNFAVNGKTVTGSVQLTSFSITAASVAFSTSMNLTIGGFGTIAGAQSAAYAGQTFTLSSANLQVHKTSGDQYAATIANVAISYASNASFLPYSGSATVSEKPAGAVGETIAVTFTAATPATKVVYVSVNGGKTFPYTLGSSGK